MSEKKRPNFLFILTDQLRRQSVSHMGGPVNTPHIDSLAETGVSFTRGYCINPICGPSRANLLTGKFSNAIKDNMGHPYWFNDRQLNPNEPSFAKSLTHSGYACSYIGKWHNSVGKGFVPRGSQRFGFDAYWAGVNVGSPRNNPHHFTDDGVKIEAGEKWEPDMQTDLAVEFLNKQDLEDPFFLTVSYLPPHTGFELSAERQYLYEEAKKQIEGKAMRKNVPERLIGSEQTVCGEIGYKAKDVDWLYHANVLGIDDCVGRLLKTLEEQNLRDDTIVVFTSDHGDQLLSQGLTGKNQLYEESVAVPVIFNCPGKIKERKSVDDFISFVDLAPTFVELGEGEVPQEMQGESFASFLKGDAEQGPLDSVYLQNNHPWYDFFFNQGPGGNKRCLVTDDWKLILIESRSGTGNVIPYQLFDIKNDPYELNNLVDDPGYAPVIVECAKKMMAWMERVDDPFILEMRTGMHGDRP